MVEQDTWSALPYSPHAEGAAAFVLYYRIERTSEADTELAGLHHDLTEITIALGGRFFLPYRHHYTQEQLLAAYPEFPEWVAAKMRVDPACVFWNEWFEHYGLPLCQHAPPVHSASDGRTHALEEEETAAGESKSAFALQFVSERRSQSMQALLQQPQQWRAFREEFLVNIFNLTDDVDLAAKITQAVMRARIEGLDDHTAYVTLQGLLKGRGALGLMADAGKAWRGVKQMHAQRRELLRQAQHILGKLGRLGSLDGLVCVGDPGKLVLELQSVCGVRGSVYVVNDQDPDAQPAIATNLTRRSISAVGRFLPFSYSKPFIPVAVPDASVDLVTMNQGLHHLPQTELMPFLASVVRVLRPGGLLIVREHNATKDLIAMCDAAHWVFNAVSGVSAADERTEVRAFRSVLEWREVLEGAGLRDSLLYEVEDGDPTQDEMMCFYKPPFWPISAAASHLPHADKPARKALVRENSGASVGGKAGTAQQVGKEHGLPRKVQEFLDSIPVSAMDGAKALFEAAEEGLPVAHAMIRERLRLVGPAQRIMVERLVDAVFPMLQDITAKVLALLRKAHVKQGNNMTDLPLDEIFLGLEMLANRPLDQVDPDSTEYTAVVAAEYIWSYLTAEPEEAHKQVKQKDAQPDVAKPLPVKGASLRTSLAQGKGTITERAVDVLIGRLIAARPDLAEQGVVERAGLSRHVTKMTGESRATLVTTLVGFLDAQGLAQLETAVVKVEHGVAQMGAAEHVRRFPAHVRVLMQSAGVPLFSSDSNPWLDVACAVLGCPAVQFTGSGKRMARWAGLQAVIDVWETAQQHRRLHSPAAPSAAELLQQDLSVVGQNVAAGETRREAMDDMMTLEMLAARMSAPSTSSALEVVVDVQSHRDSKIENVASVAHACVRARLRDRPEKGPVVLAHCTALANMILLAGEEGEHSGPRQLRLSVDNVLQLLERLGIEYEVKQEAHTKKRGYRFGDITKGLIKKIDRAIGSTMDAVQGPAKAYDKDTLELVVAWRAWDVETSKSDLAAGVSELLLQNKLVSAARLDAEEYTWYKLSEWMQVEMLAIFAGSLDTVPWYRFPYVSTLKTYFEVLIEEARIVYEKLGPQKAFASMAFITDLVPGIIMCLGFGQLALLGAPLRAYDSANWLAYDESTLTEELVVLVGGDRSGESARAMSADAIDWLALDPRIRKAVPVSKSLAVLTVPTFKPLTEILDKLSDRHNGFLPLMLVTISNHTEVQVRVALSTEGLDETSTLGALHEIDTQEGSALKFQYSFPSDTQTRYASVEVQVPHLLEFFRYCKRSDRLRLMQVYDFYDGIPAD
jgi:SAM-dependent methyltransferase